MNWAIRGWEGKLSENWLMEECLAYQGRAKNTEKRAKERRRKECWTGDERKFLKKKCFSELHSWRSTATSHKASARGWPSQLIALGDPSANSIISCARWDLELWRKSWLDERISRLKSDEGMCTGSVITSECKDSQRGPKTTQRDILVIRSSLSGIVC